MIQESILNFYKNLVIEESAELKLLLRKKSVFAWLRFGSIIAIFFAFYLLWSMGWPYVMAATVVLLIIFIRLVYADLHHFEKIQRLKIKIQLYEKEIASLEGNTTFDNGMRYSDAVHPYTSDLDIFGEYSLYQYLNRTTSEPGAITLAAFLKSTALPEIISKRQLAVKELSKITDWIKDLQVLGTQHGLTSEVQLKLENWVKQPPEYLKSSSWNWLRYVLPSVILAITFLFIAQIVSGSLFIFTLLAYLALNYQLDKKIAPIHRQLDNIAGPLKTFSESIQLIEKRTFSSELLKEIQSHIQYQNFTASGAIQRLGKILEKLDLRYNFVVSLPLNVFLLWNLQQVLSLEKWKQMHKGEVSKWLSVLAQFEALNSLAIFSYNHPRYAFPEIINEYFIAEGTSIGHPLIPEQKRIDNPVSIPSEGKIMLITGSNMAGKSTYLRSIGVNCVLAFCGAPVCAESFKISHVNLISSMRIADNLQESTSTFYAELKKLKAVIDRINAGEKMFVLLDEMLRGTNSNDRHTGSKALIRQLVEKKTAAIIATHDLELAAMKEPFAENILNYHFDVQVEKEELYFDYKLKEGVCTSMNASILMKKIGINM